MSSAIKSSAMNGAAHGGVSGASELAARLQAHARGAQAQPVVQNFASLLNQQAAPVRQDAPPPSSKAPEKAVRKAPMQDAAAKSQATVRAHEQTLMRVRQQAVAAQHSSQSTQQASAEPPETREVSDAADRQTQVSAESHPDRNEPPRSVKADQTASSPDMPDQTSTEANRLQTVLAEKPQVSPEAVMPASDQAGLMALMAGLLHEPKPDVVTGAQMLAEDAAHWTADLSESTLAEGAALEPDLASQASLGGEVQGGAVALDPLQWQQTTAFAGLQVDALLGRVSLADQPRDVRVEPGSLSGLAAGAQIRPGALPVANPVRHESATLPTPFGHADFSQALADKVSLWVNTARTDGAMTAELHLNPADMGPIQVKIALEGQSAKVDFAAAAAETRKAIEASLSALSSALSDVGLNLTGGGVTAQTAQQSFGQQSAPSEGARGVSTASSAASAAEDEGDAAFMQGVSAPRAGRPGGLDLYA